ncbi:MAG: hypothetical protein IPN70_03535 [Candidatus Moraniibacteriota bacterium]|nr:MAG: hypothetical protein IPN70_03535 [Candidatus Moranbacteria bacterium]
MSKNDSPMESPFLFSEDTKKKVFLKKKASPSLTTSSQQSEKILEKKIPVTLFTGYLGAGKTTVITNLIKEMPKNYSIAWLKNEMGNTQVDTELAQESRTATVKEMLQGCICHVMIGQLSEALKELAKTNPDRIIIETSGSATPAPVVWEIRKNPSLVMDGVITVIDAKNFQGYVHKSPTLKIQAKYTDLILINKHEDLDEFTLERNLDDLYEINLDTPKIKTDRGHIHPEIIFSLNSNLFTTEKSAKESASEINQDHHGFEVDLIEIRPTKIFDRETLLPILLKEFPKEKFYRIKGVVKEKDSPLFINCAFGDCSLTSLKKNHSIPRMIFMGEDLFDFKDLIMRHFAIKEDEIHYTPKK